MSISEALSKIKAYVGFIEKREIYASFLIFFTALASFALGRLSANQSKRTPVTVESMASVYEAKAVGDTKREVPSIASPKPVTKVPQANAGTGSYVASKSGKKYYLPACSGVKRIKDENKVWFAAESDAQAAGYTPAANCDGI